MQIWEDFKILYSFGVHMKSILTAFALLTTATTFACPQLAGNFTQCKTATGEVLMADLKIEQSNTNGIENYAITYVDPETQAEQTITYITDAQWHTAVISDPDTGMNVELSFMGKCECEKLAFFEKMSIQGQSDEIVSIEGSAQMINNKLVVTNKGQAMGDVIDVSVTCD
jgi:hypothetical protein